VHRSTSPIWSALAALFLILSLAAADAAAASARTPVLLVVGDSTARNNANGGQGWGDPLADYFDPAKLQVINRAMAGRSSRTFIAEGRWERALEELQPGDFVLIQFGHNDGGAIDTGRARASLPGLGEEAREFTMPDGRQETVRTYGSYMRQMISEAKAKGVQPILLSLTVRNLWRDGKVERGSGQFGAWTAELARAAEVPFVDLTNLIADRYEALGQERVNQLFAGDYAHTNPAGADLNAAAAVAGLQALNLPALNAALSAKGKSVGTSSAPVSPAPVAAAAPAQRPLPVPADPALPSLFLIGDSTVRNGRGDGSNGQWGWGEPLAAFFDQSKINVVNRAVGGLSSRTFLTGGFWSSTLPMIKPGDVVLIQFGHNDASPLNDNSRARGTIRSAGPEFEEIDNQLTGKREVVRSYGWYLANYVEQIRAAGATAIICSPVPRKTWTERSINRHDATWSRWAAEAAANSGALFIHLHGIIADRYDAVGPEEVEALFADAHTHTSWAGAELNAACVVAGLKGLPSNPLASFFSARAGSINPADPRLPQD
jgi:lysophospholipase L1-like esterase